MAILLANHSSYPRIGDRPEEQRIRRAFDQIDRKEIGQGDLDKILAETTQEVMTEQEQAGCDLITDGLIRWYDPVSHIMRGFKGVKIGGLLRFFDTNFYFRTPIVERKLERRDGLLLADVEASLKSARKPFKAVLTGPVTLASLSQIGGSPYRDPAGLVQDLTLLLGDEIEGLARAGVSWIQVEEPIVLKKPDLLPMVAGVCAAFARRKGKARLILATYFGDAGPLFERLADLPVEGLGLDCLYGPGLLDRIAANPGGKVWALGVLDGRTTRLEDAAQVARRLRPVIEACRGGEMHLTTSCGLEYLPRKRASEKLALLQKIREALS